MPEDRADALLARIDAMRLEGMSLDDIEGWIDSLGGVTQDQRAALWLYAWATLPEQQARQEARDTVMMLA